MNGKLYMIKIFISVDDQDEYVVETRIIRFDDSDSSLDIVNKLINKVSEQSDRMAYQLDYLREENNL